MFSRSYSPNPLISRSVSKKNHQVLDFSTLSDTEKKQYLKLLQKNNVDVAKDPNESLYVAHIKIVKQQHLEQGIQESLRSYTPDLPEDPSSSRPISKQELDSSYRGKSEKRDRSFPATNRSIEENSSRDKPKFISVQTGSSRTLSRGKNQKSSGQLVNQEGLAQYKSIKDARPLSSTKRRPRDERNRDAETFGANQVKAERKFMDRSKSPISDCTKESYNYYLEFFQMANMSACIAYLRPKKIPLESLNKIIEEIFSLQFVQGTSVVKAVVAKKKHQNAPTNSFATFVLNYLKERTVSQPRAVEQNVLNLAYSVYWFRKKSSEIEMFSRFLAGEANDDDLTFFLFLRFNTEKEMNVSLPNYPASPANVIMPVRACYKVLETIYGKYQKDLLNGIIQKVKDFIVEERERKLDFAYDGIPIYSFLLITFEDYLFNKDRCHDSIGFAEEDVINETMEEKEDSHRDMIYYPTTSDYLSHNAPNQHQGQLKNWQTLGMNQRDQYTFNPAKGKNFFTKGDENPEILQKSSSLKNHKQNTKTPEKTSSSKVNAPVPSEDNSPPGRRKRGSNPDTQSFSSITSTSGGGLDLLQELCVNLMLEKINEFINVALFERKNVQETQKELIKARLLDIFRRKFVNIIKALFSYDKTRWLDALLIEEPTTAQLKNIEELQKDLREIKKLTLDSLDKQDIAIFTNKILRTPELSIQIGRLILEFDCDKSGGAKESVY